MRIAVLLKRVPDTTTNIVIAPDGKSISEAGVKFIANPYDEFAVEEALKLRDAAGAGEVVVISLGPDTAQETIRTALAMGADRGVLLQGGSGDALEVARAIATELKGGSYDLVLCGKLAVDDYHHQVGAMVAELLGLPCITAVVALKIENGRATAEREIEGGVEVSSCAIPAVITCDKGLNNPRLPALKGIMAAKKKPLELKPAALAAGTTTVLALVPPPERKAGRIVGEGADAVPELIRLLKTEAKVL